MDSSASSLQTLMERVIRQSEMHTCLIHSGQEVIFVCDDCSGTVLCAFCLTDKHKGHNFEHIENATPKKREKLQDYISEIEKDQLQKLTQQIQFTDRQIVCNETEHKAQLRKIKRTGDNLKHETDMMTASLMSLCEEMQRENSQLLQYHREKLQTQYNQLKLYVDQCMQVLQHGSNIQVCAAEGTKLADDDTLPNVPALQVASFHISQALQENLKKAFGKLTVNNLEPFNSDIHLQPNPPAASIIKLEQSPTDVDSREVDSINAMQHIQKGLKQDSVSIAREESNNDEVLCQPIKRHGYASVFLASAEVTPESLLHNTVTTDKKTISFPNSLEPTQLYPKLSIPQDNKPTLTFQIQQPLLTTTSILEQQNSPKVVSTATTLSQSNPAGKLSPSTVQQDSPISLTSLTTSSPQISQSGSFCTAKSPKDSPIKMVSFVSSLQNGPTEIADSVFLWPKSVASVSTSTTTLPKPSDHNDDSDKVSVYKAGILYPSKIKSSTNDTKKECTSPKDQTFSLPAAPKLKLSIGSQTCETDQSNDQPSKSDKGTMVTTTLSSRFSRAQPKLHNFTTVKSGKEHGTSKPSVSISPMMKVNNETLPTGPVKDSAPRGNVVYHNYGEPSPSANKVTWMPPSHYKM